MEPYLFTLQLVTIEEPQPGHEDKGPSFCFLLSWDAQPEVTMKVYAGIKFGVHQGRYAKARSIINALFGVPEAQAIDGWDDNPIGIYYPGDVSVRALSPGLKLIGRGKFVARPDGSTGFRLEHFSPVVAQPPSAFASQPVAAAPPVQIPQQPVGPVQSAPMMAPAAQPWTNPAPVPVAVAAQPQPTAPLFPGIPPAAPVLPPTPNYASGQPIDPNKPLF